jgi:cell division protease FtsH
MDGAVHDIIAAALQRATDLLAQRRAVIERCVHALLERETLDAEALRRLIEG